jgi:hypothetical protein
MCIPVAWTVRKLVDTVILVDDGSHKSTRDILSGLAVRLKCVYCRHEKKHSEKLALVAGLKYAISRGFQIYYRNEKIKRGEYQLISQKKFIFEKIRRYSLWK